MIIQRADRINSESINNMLLSANNHYQTKTTIWQYHHWNHTEPVNFLWAPLSHLKHLFGYDESWIIETSLVQISEQYLMGMEQKVQMVVLKRGQPFDLSTDFSFLILNHLRVVISRFVIIWYESARRDQTTKAKSLGKNHL